MKEVICGIYMIQNKINGKIYIGQSINIYQRWKAHIYSSVNKPKYPLQCAIHSLGKNNFSFSILERCTKKLLNDKEKFYIALYHSNNNEFGYNLTNGGENYDWTDEMKEKHSEILTEVHNSQEFRENASKKTKQYWKEHRNEMIENRKDMYDEEFCSKISNTISDLWQNEEYKKHMSNAHKGNTSHRNNTLIRCINTNEIKTIFEWRRLGYISVTDVCKGKLRNTKGYSFEYFDESLRPTIEEINIYQQNENLKSNDYNKRLCLDPFTNLPINYGSLSRKKTKRPKI